MGLYRGRIDGVMGPKSRAALKKPGIDHRRLYLDTLDYRRRYYFTLAFDAEVRAFLKVHPKTNLHFVRGWLARCWEFVDAVPKRRA